MARYSPGPIVGDLRGRLGGVVFRGGGARASVQPAPLLRASRSARQLAQSALIGDASRAWVALNDTEKITWDEFARESLPPPSASGSLVTNGRQAFIQAHIAYNQTGVTPTLNWPAIYPYRPEVQIRIVAAPGPSAAFSLEATAGATGTGLAIWLARTASLSSYNTRAAWRPLFLGHSDGLPDFDYFPAEPLYKYGLDLSALFDARFPEIVGPCNMQARAQFTYPGLLYLPQSWTTFAVS
jgi:hypothetical protein